MMRAMAVAESFLMGSSDSVAVEGGGSAVRSAGRTSLVDVSALRRDLSSAITARGNLRSGSMFDVSDTRDALRRISRLLRSEGLVSMVLILLSPMIGVGAVSTAVMRLSAMGALWLLLLSSVADDRLALVRRDIAAAGAECSCDSRECRSNDSQSAKSSAVKESRSDI